MGWGADPAPAPAATWQDERPRGDLVHERIVGENTLKPIAYLHKALRAAEAVVRVAVRQGPGLPFKSNLKHMTAHAQLSACHPHAPKPCKNSPCAFDAPVRLKPRPPVGA